ncbi:MAG: LD-carboxypeptidase, partial [Neisseria sp.]|nr:LD-carboxypeptidase [Neisseria sp.]
MTWQTSRRHFLRACSAAAGAGLLQACGTGTTVTPSTQTGNTAKAQPVQPKTSHPPRSGDNLLRVVAPSGFAEDPNRVNAGLTRLYNAGFTVTNQQAGSRRYQRFAGSDAQRAADFQDVANGRV